MQQTAQTNATQEELAEYERLHTWRTRWGALASKRGPGRLQSRQERIERKALRCNGQIKALMRRYDARVFPGQTIPVQSMADQGADRALH